MTGLMIGTAADSGGTYVFAPLHCNIIGNILNSGVTDGTATFGLVFQGVSGGQLATGSIVGNSIIDYGRESDVAGNALYTYSTEGLTISGNSIVRPSIYGIYISSESYGTSIVGNTFYDTWSNTDTTPIGIRVAAGNNTLFIGGNNFTKDSKVATYSCVEAIRIANSAGNIIRLGENFNNGYVRYLNDAGDKCMRGTVGGLTTSSTGEDNLGTTVIAANTMGNIGRLRVTASGTKTGAGGNKTIKFYFGASSLTFHAAANNTNDWRFEAFIDNFATNGQTVTWIGWDGTTPLQGQEVFAIDTTANVTMKITGECADAGDTIVQYIWNVEHL
jgi:hypothetical protein